MDKNAIKKYAVWARRELIERVAKKAQQYGIEENVPMDANADSINGKVLTASEKKERQALIAQIKDKGYEQVMEEVAYTWFNRFSALRFMEVNGYLPSHVRVFTDEENNFKPQILTEAIHLEMDRLDMDKVYELKDTNKTDELYKYLIITQCNALNMILPGMFQEIADYTELLLPDNLLREGSVIEQMIAIIPEEDWKDAVQILGWMYQYYIAEPKDVLINARAQYKDSDISVVTQLFTSDWIVRYMVENSLGRLWQEAHPNESLEKNWSFYLKNSDGNITEQSNLTMCEPEQIKCIDPCSGSGHILAYTFDVLMQIYESYGYTTRDAVASIVNHNIYGLDIDERAAQLAYFSVMMKARQYDRRFFSRDIQPQVYSIQDSNHVQYDKEYGDFLLSEEHRSTLIYLLSVFKDAREYGSILNIEMRDYKGFLDAWEKLAEGSLENIMMMSWYMSANEIVPQLAKQAMIMSQKYEVIVTNPPYMNSTYMPDKLRSFVQNNYADFKTDLFSAFIAKLINWCKPSGHVGILTPYVWMFLLSYEKMREYLLTNCNITSMVQLEYNAFEGACVPVCGMTFKNTFKITNGEYVRLSDFKGVDNQAPKTLEAVKNPNCGYRYSTSQSNYTQIPGKPIAYWLNKTSVDLFDKGSLMSDYVDLKQGLITGDNNRFLRFWQECDACKITNSSTNPQKWFFYHKGGEYRKWYGNINLVVNWENDGNEIVNFRDSKGKQKSRPQNVRFYLREGFTWTALTIADFNVRYMPEGCIFDAKGSSGFPQDSHKINYFIGLCNSKVAMEFLSFLSPTMDYNAGAVGKIPVLVDESKIEQVNKLVAECIDISKTDWDSFENSWNFGKSPLVRNTTLISDAYEQWAVECTSRFNQLKANEETLNDLFIQIYGLDDNMDSKVENESVTVHLADRQRDIKGLISYAVGCMFGRYSLDKEGLVFAGGKWNESQYIKFPVDQDNIIPIGNDEYFTDDLMNKFIDFIETVYGKNSLEQNLQYIAETLGGKGQSREILRSYFLNDFYADHCNIYSVAGSGKRPIYWLFDSGKKNGFKALMYMHRYQQDTIARMRTDYVHEQQGRYRTEIEDLEARISGASTSDRVKLNKQLSTLQDKSTEIRLYEEKLHHLADKMIRIELDDGVKNNYAIFQDVLAKIK